MSFYLLSIISACSIAVPFGATMLRWNRLKHKYLLLAVLLTVGLLNEAASISKLSSGGSNCLNGNIYVLVDFILINLLFIKLRGTFSQKFFAILMILGVALWVTDNLVIHSLFSNNSLFRMGAALIIVLIAIDKVNQLVFTRDLALLKNTDFLLSTGFLVYYAYKTFVEAFNIFPMPIARTVFYRDLWVIMCVINIGTNLLITAAILCIQHRQESILRLSLD
jgi:hypothetical protein